MPPAPEGARALPNVTNLGKGPGPDTSRAREAFAGRGYAVDYVNVKKNAADLQRMLAASGGRRDVPVILEDGKVTIGYGGT